MKLFTIGYGGRKTEDSVGALRENGVRAVVDVRLRPNRASMSIYVKAKSPDKGIEGLLSKAGTAYHFLPELGNIFLDYEDSPRRYAGLLEKARDLLIERLSDIPQPFCLLLVAHTNPAPEGSHQPGY